mgnify:CR=1 FL=1
MLVCPGTGHSHLLPVMRMLAARTVAAGVVLYNQRFELSGLAEPTEPDKPIDIFFQRPPEPKPLPPTVTAAPPRRGFISNRGSGTSSASCAAAKPLATIGPVGRPVGEPPSCSRVIS